MNEHDGPTTAENYRVPVEYPFVGTHRITPTVIDAPAIIRGPPKILPMNDVFLDYLEFVKLPQMEERQKMLKHIAIGMGAFMALLPILAWGFF